MRVRSAVAEKVPDRTLRRVLSADDGVKAEARREVIDQAVGVLIPDDLLTALGFAAPDGDAGAPAAFRRAFAEVVAAGLADWDAASGLVRGGGAPVPDGPFALLPWVRMFAVELGVRVGGYLAAVGVQRVDEAGTAALVAGRSFDGLIDRYRQVAGGISRDELARGAAVSGSTVDEWLAGKALPQGENILQLAAVFAQRIPGLSEAEAAFHLRVSVAASEAVRWLWQVCPPPGNGHELGPPRAAQFVIEFLVVLEFALSQCIHAPVPVEHRWQAQWEVAIDGSGSQGGQAILAFALHRARDSYLRADVFGVLKGRWTERALMLYRQIPTVEGERSAPLPAGFPAEMLQLVGEHLPMFVQMQAWGNVSPNPFGWLMPVVPSDDPPSEDEGDVVLCMPSEMRATGAATNRAFEAQHARGDEVAAFEEHRRLVRLEPKNALYRYWLGCSLAKFDRVDEAIIECRIACDLDPSRSVYAVEVPIILTNAGRNPEALESFRAMEGKFEVDDHYANAHGFVLMVAGLHDEAISWFRRALAVNREHARAMRDLAHCLFASGKGVEARRWSKAARNRGEPWTYQRWEAGDYERGRVPALPWRNASAN